MEKVIGSIKKILSKIIYNSYFLWVLYILLIGPFVNGFCIRFIKSILHQINFNTTEHYIINFIILILIGMFTYFIYFYFIIYINKTKQIQLTNNIQIYLTLDYISSLFGSKLKFKIEVSYIKFDRVYIFNKEIYYKNYIEFFIKNKQFNNLNNSDMIRILFMNNNKLINELSNDDKIIINKKIRKIKLNEII